MNTFTITTLLTKKDYTPYLYRVAYKKPYYVIVTSLGLLSLSYGIYSAVTIANFAALTPFLPIGLFFIVIPTINILIARKSTFSNKVIKQPVVYVFSETSITIKAVTAESVYVWQHVEKVTEDKVFLLLWVTKKVANFIKKDGLTRGQIDFIKAKVGAAA